MQPDHSPNFDVSAKTEQCAIRIENLADLRGQIDEIDERIVLLLATRFAVTEKVGELKASLKIAATDAKRESQQTQRYKTLAENNFLNPDTVNQVFRIIISEVVSNHQRAASRQKEQS